MAWVLIETAALPPGFNGGLNVHLDLKASKVRTVVQWGNVRPAHTTPGSQKVLVQFQKGSSGPFKTLQTVTVTNPQGYFDVNVKFPSSGTVQTTWSYQHGPTIHSRPVSVTVK